MYKILLVEIQSKIPQELRLRLKELGFQIIGPIQPKQGAIQTKVEMQPDLALVHISFYGQNEFDSTSSNMPSSNAIQVAEEIRSLLNIPIIYSASEIDQTLLENDQSTRPPVFLTKPYTNLELKSLIRLTLYNHELENALSDIKIRFHDLYDNAPNAYLTIKPNGEIQECNQRFAAILARECEDLIGASLYKHCSQTADGAPKAKKLLEDCLQEQKIHDKRVQMIKSNSKPIWLSLSMKTIENEIGKGTAINIIGIDITSRVLAENQINLQAAALNSAANGIVITDRRGIIHSVNQAFTNLTGYSKEEVVGKSTNMLKSGVHNADFYSQMWQTIQSGQVWRGELTNRRKDGSLYIEEMTITPVKDSYGEITHFIAIKQDVSKRVAAEQRLQYLATHDNLTGLANRTLFYESLNHALNSAKRSGNQIAVMYLDLDGFKFANDEYGHQTGDVLLSAVAVRLTENLRASDTLARMGGDEFTICLENISDSKDASIVAEKIIDIFAEPFEINGKKISLSTSIGISIYPQDGKNADELLAKADSALYLTKNKGKNDYRFFTTPQV